MGWLSFGYFVSCIPYAMPVKALASGVTPLSSQRISGFEMLPASVLGQLAAMMIFLGVSGRWQHMRRSGIGGGRIPVARQETLAAGLFTSLIIGTTTMNYTFAGVSILFMLLLMRGGVLILSPLIDRAGNRPVMKHSWPALFVFASMIHLDRREYTWGVPAWAFASLMSGLVASYALAWPAGLPAPGSSQLIALVFGVGAAAALSCPSAVLWRRTRGTGAACRVLFVCGGNTCRSPMAEVIAWAEAMETGVAHAFRLSSAGLATPLPGRAMAPGARSALAQSPEAYRRCAQHIQRSVRGRLCELAESYGACGTTPGRG
ncbi:hypothetical protein ACIQ9J_28275 [Streptomyces sp. NPDC094153]|uniref:arsenate reductase/protein-tyrosine-phosphatase family protein n=1 Tax=Streptomyces sp. NPDC094153 TaxID=3366058 RepID=UPI00382B0D8C